jgi:hypothetical protein
MIISSFSTTSPPLPCHNHVLLHHQYDHLFHQQCHLTTITTTNTSSSSTTSIIKYLHVRYLM